MLFIEKHENHPLFLFPLFKVRTATMHSITTTPEQDKLAKRAHLYAAWPLILIVFGGAIGLLYGALAYLINLKVYGSELSKLNKILANLLCGMSALSAWWFTAQWVQAYF